MSDERKEVIELTVAFLRDIKRQCPAVLKIADIDAFIMNELNPLLASPQGAQAYWLIERGSPAEWWAGTATTKHWTRNVNEVHPLLKFPSKEKAEGEARRIQHWPAVHGSELRVTEHVDLPAPQGAQETAGVCPHCGAITATACNDKGCFYLESGAQEGETPETDALRNKGHTTIEQWVVLCERLERRLRARDVAHSECPSEGCCIVGPDEDCPKLQNVAPQPHRDMAAPEPRMPASAAPEQRSAMPEQDWNDFADGKITVDDMLLKTLSRAESAERLVATLAEQVEGLKRIIRLKDAAAPPISRDEKILAMEAAIKQHFDRAESADQRARRMEELLLDAKAMLELWPLHENTTAGSPSPAFKLVERIDAAMKATAQEPK